MSGCPVCAAELYVAKETRAGDWIICEACGAELEVLQVDPTVLSGPPGEDEDWD